MDRPSGGAPAEGAARQLWLASPPFCCGLSWLVNVLLELGIRATYSQWQGRHWEEGPEGSRMTCLAWEHLRWHLAAAAPERVFAFEPGSEVVWGHELRFARRPAPAVLFVRDVRDAVHSLWRRDHASELPLERYLEQSTEWPDHFPGCFGLPPADTWALFVAFWRAAGAAMPLLIVRFEDARREPVATVERVLGHFGFSRSREAVEAAVESSSVERLRAAVARHARETGWAWQTARRGCAAEWREWPERKASLLLSPLAVDVMADLGYEVPAPAVSGPDPEWLHLAAIGAREILAGGAAWLLPRLRAAAERAPSNRAAALALCHLALRWTASIFPRGGPPRAVSAAAQEFTRLLLRHADWPPLAEAARVALESDELPEPADPPRRDHWSPPRSARETAPGMQVPTIEEASHVAT
ncbi:MAG: hypothetical protein D6718_00925 [Acidobacteria bacterium]|nr:MAG: hypothetical protein D6718_00925 [Acidobacteriota bacterium]